MNVSIRFRRAFLNFSISRASPESRNAFGLIPSKTGLNINSRNAMEVTAVFACVRLLAENIASLPLSLFRRTDTGTAKAVNLPLYSVLHDVPNPETDSFQFWQAFLANLLVFGRGYAEVVRDNGGRIVQLWNITTPFVQARRNKNTQDLEYWVTPSGQESFTLRKDQILRVDWFSMDALNTFRPLSLARNAIGLSEAAEEYASAYFKNGANVSGVIEYPDEMEDNEAERFRKDVRENYSGLSNTARLMFLEQGSKFTKIANSPQESQMLDTRKFQVEEVARFYNVPLHMIGDLDHATFSNIEQMSLNFVIYTLRPYLVRIERAISAQLLTPTERLTLYPKFSVEGLLRGDYLSRMQGYQAARNGGWMSANEIRQLEDMDRYPADEGGDVILANGALRSLAALAKAPAESTKNGGESK